MFFFFFFFWKLLKIDALDNENHQGFNFSFSFFWINPKAEDLTSWFVRPNQLIPYKFA